MKPDSECNLSLNEILEREQYKPTGPDPEYRPAPTTAKPHEGKRYRVQKQMSGDYVLTDLSSGQVMMTAGAGKIAAYLGSIRSDDIEWSDR